MTQETRDNGFWDSSGISWTICKQYAPRSRQITTATPHHSIFTGRMLFLTPNQQCQSTEGILVRNFKFGVSVIKVVVCPRHCAVVGPGLSWVRDPHGYGYGVGMGIIFHPHRPMGILWGFLINLK